MTLRVSAGGVAVTVQGDAVEETTRAMERLAYDGVPAALMSKTTSLWGSDAAARAPGRLGWVDLPETARRLLPELDELRDLAGVVPAAGRAEAPAPGLSVSPSPGSPSYLPASSAFPAPRPPRTPSSPGPERRPEPLGPGSDEPEPTASSRGVRARRVVLAGTGGPAEAARAMTRAAGVEPVVLDTPDPLRVRQVIDEGLDDTVLVVADPSGATIEIDALRRVFELAFRSAGLAPAERVIVVTDPGSPLEAEAEEAGLRIVLSDPEASGGFAALTAAALVPAALWGVDVAALLDAAAGLRDALRLPYDNPGLALGAALGGATGRDRLVLAGATPGPPPLGGWIEHLLAVALGKNSRGVLPLGPKAAGAPAADALRVVLGEAGDEADVAVSGPPGAGFPLWQFAAALAARLTGVDPFDDPGVREAQADVAALMRGTDGGAPPTLVHAEPLLVDDAVEVHGDARLLRGARDLPGVIDALAGAVPDRGYLAITAYLDPVGDAAVAAMRTVLARRAAAPVTFGWGPAARHGIGQYHRYGPPSGVFVQITGAAADIPVPGRPYGLCALQLAQAFADLRALRARGRPAVRLHLRHRAAGLARLADALGG